MADVPKSTLYIHLVDELDPFFNGRRCLNSFLGAHKSVPSPTKYTNSQKKQKSGSQGGGSERSGRRKREKRWYSAGEGVVEKEEAKQKQKLKKKLVPVELVSPKRYIRALYPHPSTLFSSICNIRLHPWDRRRGRGPEGDKNETRDRVRLWFHCLQATQILRTCTLTAQTRQKVWPGCIPRYRAVRIDEPLAFTLHSIPYGRDTTERYHYKIQQKSTTYDVL